MKTFDWLNMNYLDILYLDRNKTYGAYALTKNYNKTALASLGIWCSLFILSLALGWANQKSINQDVASETMSQSPVDALTMVEVQLAKIELKPDVVQTAAVERTTVKHVTAKIVKNHQVLPKDKPQDPNDKNNLDADISNKNFKSDQLNKASDIENPFGEELKGTKGDPTSLLVKKTPNEGGGVGGNNIYKKVDQFAQKPKDLYQMIKKMLRYPQMAKQEGISGQVIVSFVVEKDGSISNLKLEGPNPGGGLDEEAIRVLKMSPKWEPAILNGEPVRSYFKLPIQFNLSQS